MTVIAAFGDSFILPGIWEEVLRKRLSSLVSDLEFVFGVSEWPAVPFQYNQEIQEYVGDPEEIADLANGADVIVTHLAPITRSVIERNQKLKIIGCCRGGPVNVNIQAATQFNIPVVFAPGRNAQAVAEFTLGLLLAEAKSIARAHSTLTQGVWQGDYYRYDQAPRELHGVTIGLIGFGVIAQMLVPYLRPFGMHILAYDPYVPESTFARLGVERVSLPELLSSSDVISLHARVTPETRKMIGEKEFRQMKPGAYFINTGRGALVDYEALYRALQDGHLSGAGLDTFDIEPIPADSPLLKLKNVTLTPHIAGSSKETAYRSVDIIAQDLVNYFTNKPLAHCANPKVYTATAST